VKELKFTLYEIFGYILPGSIFCFAIAIIFISVFITNSTLHIAKLTAEMNTIIIVLFYFNGHVVQALGNIFARILKVNDMNIATKISIKMSYITNKINDDVTSKLELPNTVIPLDELYMISDELNAISGNTEDREIYQYREGFYRGLFVSCSMLSLALVVKIIDGAVYIDTGNYIINITRQMMVFVLAASAIGCCLFYNRYIRFISYRIRHAFISYIVVKKLKQA